MALKPAYRSFHFHISPEVAAAWVLPAALLAMACAVAMLCAVIPWS
jgi:hypothetical protein